MSAPESTDAWERLRAARPTSDNELLSPHTPAASALMEEIVSMDTPAEPRARSHRLVAVAAGVTAVAVAIGVGVAASSNDSDQPQRNANAAPVSTKAATRLVNIRAIATRSRAALESTGRARITFAQSGGSSGASDVTFAGANTSSTITFAGEQGRPGFSSYNMSIDGDFYLKTFGPDGVTRWYRDTNSKGEVWESDPRTLLGSLEPAAKFVDVGAGMIDGVAVRHLRATALAALPSLNLSMGPIDAHELKTLDLWVGSDDVVRRLDVTTAHDEQVLDPKTAPKLEKRRDGTIAIIDADGTRTVTQGEALQAALDRYPKITQTSTAKYSVHFFEIGAPIHIERPAGAVDVAAKG